MVASADIQLKEMKQTMKHRSMFPSTLIALRGDPFTLHKSVKRRTCYIIEEWDNDCILIYNENSSMAS